MSICNIRKKKNVQQLLGFLNSEVMESYFIYALSPSRGSMEPQGVLDDKIRRLSLLLSHLEEGEIFVTDGFREHTTKKEYLMGLWKSESSPEVRRLLAREMESLGEEEAYDSQRGYYLVIQRKKRNEDTKHMKRIVESEAPQALLLSEEEKRELLYNYFRHAPNSKEQPIAMLFRTEEG